MEERRFSQPLDVAVNPHKWTTKVNVALVVAVGVLFIAGVGYGIYAIMHTSEVQQDVHEDVAPAPGK